MKAALTILISTTFSVAAFSQTWTRPGDAYKFEGNTVNVIGFVEHISKVAGAKGDMTLCINGKDMSPTLNVVVRTAGMNKPAVNESHYLHQYVHVKGRVRMHKGHPHIFVHHKGQISVTREGYDEGTLEPF